MRARESAFGLVELVVVLIIIAVVFLMAFSGIQSSKADASGSRARAVAVNLGEAVQQFQRDHGGRPPGDPGGADWNGTHQSPVDRGNANKPYARPGSLASLADGTVVLLSGSADAPPTAAASIRYLHDDAREQYALVLATRKHGKLQVMCYLSSGTDAEVRSLVANTGATNRC